MSITNDNDLYRITEVELTYKNKVPANDRIRIRHEADAYKVLMNVWDLNKIELVEQFKILLLGQKTELLGVADICTGGLDYCIPDSRIIFSTALKAKAKMIILAHNHPSGDLTPSRADITVTEDLAKAARLLKMQVVDHFIVSSQSYLSMANQGLVP